MPDRILTGAPRAALSSRDPLARAFPGLVPLVLVVAVGAGACAAGDAPGPGPAPLFVEVAARSGIDFTHENGAEGEFNYPELVQPGAGFVDYDGDGDLDVYLIQSGPLPVDRASDRRANRLFRNKGDGTFEDVTAATGAGDRGYGAGVAAADFDADGDVDLYVTNLGRNTLLRNDGGRFTDVTEAAGVGDDGYSTSAAFADVDGDGDLDLFVCNYVAWTPEIERPCLALNGVRDYCSPGTYQRPQRDTLYRNNGDGSFDDVSREAGIHAAAAAGLGVTTGDFDGDGHVDIYVANDQMPNHLWMNNADGTFSEEALVRGCALNEYGQAEAGMGVASEDIDGDGHFDLFMVHLDGETNTLYRNVGGQFRDATDEHALGAVSRAYTGFGVGLFDYDHDGWFDLFIANGRVRRPESLDAAGYAETNQLLRGLPDGRFEDVSLEAGPALALVEISRGAAFGDYDDDGDVDVLVANNGGPARLLRNEAAAGHWLIVRLECTARDRDCIGARVEVEAGGRTRQRIVQPAYSYCATNDPRLHFGLGDAESVERVSVTWPGGAVEHHGNVAADRLLVLREPATRGPARTGR